MKKYMVFRIRIIHETLYVDAENKEDAIEKSCNERPGDWFGEEEVIEKVEAYEYEG